MTNLQPSGLTNSIFSTLFAAWGYEGFLLHTKQVSQLYREKRDVFEVAMRRHLTGLAQWDTPEAGMFFWYAPHKNTALSE